MRGDRYASVAVAGGVSPALTAEASRAEAAVAEQKQELKGEQTRAQVDQSVTNDGVAAARNDLRDNWTKP